MSNDSLKIPLLDFDPGVPAMIEPADYISKRGLPEHCVLCFFREIVEKVRRENAAGIAVRRNWEDGPHPIYVMKSESRRFAFFQPGVGSPTAAGLMEEAIAMGCRKFIACGGAGNLHPDVPMGHLIVPTSAVRDEGTSFHYHPPSREIEADMDAVKIICDVLDEEKLPYTCGKTWTTDAPYRETAHKAALRREEGCVTVEMEASAFFAVSRFRKVKFGQILYSGDDLSGEVWDSRGWSRSKVREKLFWLAVEACFRL